MADDFLHIVDKAHIKHPIGLIQHQHFDGPQVNRAPLKMIHQPPRCSHHNIHPATQGPNLVFHTDAAVHRQCTQLHKTSVFLDTLFNLYRQFPRRRQNQRPYALLSSLIFMAEPVQNRQHKRRRLAGTRLGTANKIPACKNSGNCFGLNFGRSRVAGGKDTLHQRVAKTK